MFYRPARVAYPDEAAIELMQRLRFGLIVSVHDGEPYFSHLPLLVDVEDGKLKAIRGHFARANDHWKALRDDPEATIIFTGPNAYVSAQWYTPGNPAAPTWNYAVVHVQGTIRLAENDDETNKVINDLILANERELPTQWDLAGYPADRRAALVPHIIGFELRVTKLEPKFKLTQHYGDADKRGAAAGLMARGTDATREIAQYMLSTCTDDGNRAGYNIRDVIEGTVPRD